MTMETEVLGTRSRGRAHTYEEVSRILKISKRQLIREIRAGALKADRLSERVIRIFDDALDEYISRGR